jgi:arsenate reductase-like glutaredoxin family protein
MRKGVIAMDGITNSCRRTSVPVRDMKKFDTPAPDKKEDGIISRTELEAILSDLEKKTEFLSTIVSEVARLEKRANEILKDKIIEGITAEDFIERPLLYLKAIYFDIVTGKANKWLAADFELLREKMVRNKEGIIMYKRFME